MGLQKYLKLKKGKVVKGVPGSRCFQAKVMVRVVINVLSAAGSRIVPITDCMLYLRAIYPSTYVVCVILGFRGIGSEQRDPISDPCVDKKRRCRGEVPFGDRPAQKRTC